MVIHDNFSDLSMTINVLVLFRRLGFTSWGGVAGVYRGGGGGGGGGAYIYELLITNNLSLLFSSASRMAAVLY